MRSRKRPRSQSFQGIGGGHRGARRRKYALRSNTFGRREEHNQLSIDGAYAETPKTNQVSDPLIQEADEEEYGDVASILVVISEGSYGVCVGCDANERLRAARSTHRQQLVSVRKYVQ